MARYEPLGDIFNNQRLGSFEGEFGEDFDTSFDTGGQSTTAAESGTGQVLQGIGAILAPLAQAGVGIFAATQQAKLEKARLKAEAQAAARRPTFQQPMFIPQQKKSSAGPIIAILGGMTVLAVVLILVLKKK